MATNARIDIEPKGRFSTALKIAIESTGMSLTDLAQKVDSTYENMRKLVSGRSFPSIHLLKALAKTLGANPDEWLELIEADKLHKRYKKLPSILKLSPELEPFEAIIPHLSEQARQTLLSMAKTMQKQEASASRR